MATYIPAKRATEFIFWTSLVSQANSNIMQANPTLAIGDVKVSVDGGTLNNITTLPVVTPAVSKIVKVTLSATEMTGDNIMVVFSDASGAEWQDQIWCIPTSARQIDDLSTVTEAQVNAQCDTALSDYDAPTKTELDAGLLALNDVTAAEVWAATTRTLTSTAAATTAAVTGSTLNLTIALSYAHTLSSVTIPATWTTIYFTIKSSQYDADSASILQIEENNPGALTDGLLYLNGAAGTAAQASLTVNQAGGTVAIWISHAATAQLAAASNLYYDIKCLTSDTPDNSQVLTGARCNILAITTRAIT